MRFSGLSVRQSEAFEATMVAGSVSGAATALSVSQPSVSRLLQELEIDTGLSLFDRSHGRLVPTEQGLLFYGEVSKTFHGARNLIMAAQEIRQLKRGVVRIGTLAAMSFKIVPAAIQQLRTRFPEARTTIAVRSSTEIVSSVASRLTDIGVVDAGVSFLDTTCVATFERNSVCVMDERHPLAGRDQVRLEDFARYPFVSLGELYFRRNRDGAKLLEATAANTVADIFQSFLACALVRGGQSLAVVDPFTASFYSDFGLVLKETELDIPFRTSILVNDRSATGAAAGKVIETMTDLIGRG
ncbi:LysR substrate-binding domain-containing protein [Mesorhizobium sp.]|uniref:LysR substrate-binding domain-containing protein n=1 Tax=Mesorhizobium sp. TaxID=1871066 RepID=UPI000FE38EF8|nr:LysR substrate-binding domain-containing protein [Mesorhizobium sp.]RWC03475.1 MAG: LysR family transcriptional regulator [Mesorhizobium sp.]RWP04520.1 MAG: LysR family transcriptional regulator [Mesorhizobium sp.]RWP33179.1 MAG: LysR family transcriptional regulator [Mesorhizobium sp.]RWP69006.1 MAG: LysR family transcriptional regulator [Mesorhizobium sp.]RWQ17215.1 MAG: LysR family transcriptional regulator [Mesorhizobium sp.]